MMRALLLALAMLAPALAAGESQTVYRSVDESGAVSFSDRAPQDGREAQQLQVDVPQPVSVEEHRQRMESISDSADRMAAERRAREKHRAEMRELAARSRAYEQPGQEVVYERSPSYVLAPRYHRPWRPPHRPPHRPPDRPQPLPPVAPAPGATDLRAANAGNSQLMRPMLPPRGR